MNILNKLKNYIFFRTSDELNHANNTPKYTVGSIVWGAILRSAFIMVLCFMFYGTWWFRQYWWVSFFALWFFAAYPAYRQYQNFNEKIEDLETSTLCGSCRFFESTGQLCSKYDEHISAEYIPCEGLDWEPKENKL